MSDTAILTLVLVVSVATFLLVLIMLLMSVVRRDVIVWRGVSNGEFICEKASMAAVKCQSAVPTAEETSSEDELDLKKAFD